MQRHGCRPGCNSRGDLLQIGLPGIADHASAAWRSSTPAISAGSVRKLSSGVLPSSRSACRGIPPADAHPALTALTTSSGPSGSSAARRIVGEHCRRQRFQQCHGSAASAGSARAAACNRDRQVAASCSSALAHGLPVALRSTCCASARAVRALPRWPGAARRALRLGWARAVGERCGRLRRQSPCALLRQCRASAAAFARAGVSIGQQLLRGCTRSAMMPADRAEQKARKQPDQDEDVDRLQRRVSTIEMHQCTNGLANSSSSAMTRQ